PAPRAPPAGRVLAGKRERGETQPPPEVSGADPVAVRDHAGDRQREREDQRDGGAGEPRDDPGLEPPEEREREHRRREPPGRVVGLLARHVARHPARDPVRQEVPRRPVHKERKADDRLPAAADPLTRPPALEPRAHGLVLYPVLREERPIRLRALP